MDLLNPWKKVLYRKCLSLRFHQNTLGSKSQHRDSLRTSQKQGSSTQISGLPHHHCPQFYSDQLSRSSGRVCEYAQSPVISFSSVGPFSRRESKLKPNKKGFWRKNIILCLRETTFLPEERTFLWQLQRAAGFGMVGLQSFNRVAALKMRPWASEADSYKRTQLDQFRGLLRTFSRSHLFLPRQPFSIFIQTPPHTLIFVLASRGVTPFPSTLALLLTSIPQLLACFPPLQHKQGQGLLNHT